jgi:hypothetical protein
MIGQSLLGAAQYTEPDFAHYQVSWINRSCCLCRVAYFPDAKFTICGHWRIRLGRPILISFGFLAIFASFVYDLLSAERFPGRPHTNLWTYVCLGVVSFLALCVACSYLVIICRGPGYAPYNWAYIEDRNPSWERAMSSLVIFEQQAEIARSSRRPAHASYSREARRFVLRADHYCLWTESWIGIRNHRHFMLMTAYIGLFALAYVAFRVLWVLGCVKEEFQYWWLIGAVATVAIVAAGGFGLYHFAIAVQNLIVGVTSVERYKMERHGAPTTPSSQGCVRNCEDVCGHRALCLCWLLPCCVCIEPLEDGFYANALAAEARSEAGDQARPLAP